MARPGITAPIASATSVEQIRDLVQATKVLLDNDDIAQLDRASNPA
jgi:aryl-alcohol dehydrogenase-like predicted oxidoreductase